MKKYLCILIALGFAHIGYGQFERQWSSVLVSEHDFVDVNSVHLVNEKIVFNQVSYNEDHDIILNELKIFESQNGDELWNFNWSDHFPLHARIKILPLSAEQVYFVVNISGANGMDHYGVINLFGEIVWQKALVMSSETVVTTLETNLLIDKSYSDEINRLLLIDKDGNELWVLEDGEYDNWNKLVSNGKDRAIWLKDNGLALIDLPSQILARDSLSNYPLFYTHFEILENGVISLTWDPYNFIIKKCSNNFESCSIDTLGYAYNVFGKPKPTIISETNGNTFVASDYTDNWESFIMKYDENLEKQWVNDSEDKIINVFPDTEEVIVIDINTINVLDNVTGALLYETNFDANERILNPYDKNEIYDDLNESLYVFTLDSLTYLNQYKKTLTSTTNFKEDNKMSLYPVPVKNKLFLKNVSEFNTIYVYDVNGQLLLNTDNTKGYINTESLPQGSYVLQLVNSSHSITKKFIKM